MPKRGSRGAACSAAHLHWGCCEPAAPAALLPAIHLLMPAVRRPTASSFPPHLAAPPTACRREGPWWRPARERHACAGVAQPVPACCDVATLHGHSGAGRLKARPQLPCLPAHLPAPCAAAAGPALSSRRWRPTACRSAPWWSPSTRSSRSTCPATAAPTRGALRGAGRLLLSALLSLPRAGANSCSPAPLPVPPLLPPTGRRLTGGTRCGCAATRRWWRAPRASRCPASTCTPWMRTGGWPGGALSCEAWQQPGG